MQILSRRFCQITALAPAFGKGTVGFQPCKIRLIERSQRSIGKIVDGERGDILMTSRTPTGRDTRRGDQAGRDGGNHEKQKRRRPIRLGVGNPRKGGRTGRGHKSGSSVFGTTIRRCVTWKDEERQSPDRGSRLFAVRRSEDRTARTESRKGSGRVVRSDVRSRAAAQNEAEATSKPPIPGRGYALRSHAEHPDRRVRQRVR